MSDKYKIHAINSPYFITATVVRWIDVFTSPDYKLTIIDSLKYCQKHKGLEIYAWCLMSNHLHMICRVVGQDSLSDFLRDFKKFTSKKIVKQIIEKGGTKSKLLLSEFEFAGRNLNRIENFKFWQDGNQAKMIFTNEFLWQKLEYIHMNPVRQLIVANPEDYLFSSARNYADLSSVIDVVKISPKIRRW